MKIDARFEQIQGRERPILFFTDDVERDRSIAAYSDAEGHVQSSRSYMRRCRKPTTNDDFFAIWSIIERYAKFSKSV